MRQTVLERQDLSCTYLAHHELESVVIIVIIIIMVVIAIIIIIIFFVDNFHFHLYYFINETLLLYRGWSWRCGPT